MLANRKMIQQKQTNKADASEAFTFLSDPVASFYRQFSQHATHSAHRSN